MDFIKEETNYEEVPDYLIPLNPPPVPKLIENGYDASFMRNFEEATNYILYAATACTRLRVNEEITRRSKLRWYSVLADLYDRYKEVVNQMPSLKDGDRRVKEASELADGKKKDRLRRKALAKEVMAGRRINKILTALKGQWHIIELHDFITREFLINNDAGFFENLLHGISWPEISEIEFNLPYKLVPDSGSMYQYALLSESSNNYYNYEEEVSDNHEEEVGDNHEEEVDEEEVDEEEVGDNHEEEVDEEEVDEEEVGDNHEEEVGDNHEEKGNDNHEKEDEKEDEEMGDDNHEKDEEMGDDNHEKEDEEMGDDNHEKDEEKGDDDHEEADEEKGDNNREKEDERMGDNGDGNEAEK